MCVKLKKASIEMPLIPSTEKADLCIGILEKITE